MNTHSSTGKRFYKLNNRQKRLEDSLLIVSIFNSSKERYKGMLFQAFGEKDLLLITFFNTKKSNN